MKKQYKKEKSGQGQIWRWLSKYNDTPDGFNDKHLLELK